MNLFGKYELVEGIKVLKAMCQQLKERRGIRHKEEANELWLSLTDWDERETKGICPFCKKDLLLNGECPDLLCESYNYNTDELAERIKAKAEEIVGKGFKLSEERKSKLIKLIRDYKESMEIFNKEFMIKGISSWSEEIRLRKALDVHRGELARFIMEILNEDFKMYYAILEVLKEESFSIPSFDYMGPDIEDSIFRESPFDASEMEKWVQLFESSMERVILCNMVRAIEDLSNSCRIIKYVYYTFLQQSSCLGCAITMDSNVFRDIFKIYSLGALSMRDILLGILCSMGLFAWGVPKPSSIPENLEGRKIRENLEFLSELRKSQQNSIFDELFQEIEGADIPDEIEIAKKFIKELQKLCEE